MKKSERFRHLPGFTLALTGIIMLFVTININWGKDHWNQIVRSDAEGYYAYLPAVFIYHDLNFGFFEEIEKVKYYDPFNFCDYRIQAKGKLISKCYAGEALAIAPFWLGAHALAKSAGYDADGYSKPYTVSVTIAAIFYLILGLFFLNRVLRQFDVTPWMRSLVLAAALFGTNLFYYSVGEPAVTHVYSFGLMTMFVYYAGRYFRTSSARMLPVCGFILGMIILIRPVNGLVLLALPLAAGSWQAFAQGMKNAVKKPLWLSFAIIGTLMVISIQAIIYKISTGSFFVYAYGDETFNFLSPHFFDFLFSYKKGYFLYTPLAFIALAGLWFMWKKSPFSFMALGVFLVFIIYMLSSWWNWWYGGSFSSRVMVEYLVFFMIPLGLALEGIKKRWLKGVYISLIVLLIGVCQIQTYQYRYHRIHWEKMNRELYWNVFLRIDQIR